MEKWNVSFSIIYFFEIHFLLIEYQLDSQQNKAMKNTE